MIEPETTESRVEDLPMHAGWGRRVVARLVDTVVICSGIFTIPLLISYLGPLWNEKNQTWQDSAVSSVVVHT